MRRPAIVGATALAAVILTAVLASPADGIAIVGHFVDDDGHTFEIDIDAIAEANITKGCNPPANTNFCPDLDVSRGAMAAFLRRALNLPASSTDHFTDDDTSIFEGDINSIADAGITKGCNPPANTRYCPDLDVDRGAMAAFLRRAFSLPASPTDHFIDDNGSIFEHDINSIADAGITKGCNPPTNSQYCPNDAVSRGAMAAFLRRALGLPAIELFIPLSDHGAINCTKDGESCALTVDVVAGRAYNIEEGLFQVDPATPEETSEFNAGNTYFDLRLNGSTQNLSDLGVTDEGSVLVHLWTDTLTFSAGTHTLIGRWRWDGDIFMTTTVTVRASS